MKAILFKSVMCVALVLAGALNTNLIAGNKYVSNDEIKDGQVVSKTIYLHEKELSRHMKYDYTYNESGLMTGKESFKWNEKKQSWTPYYRINYTYSKNRVTMDFARWNPEAKAYNLKKERAVYALHDAITPVSYISYKWDDSLDTWAFAGRTDLGNNVMLYATVK